MARSAQADAATEGEKGDPAVIERQAARADSEQRGDGVGRELALAIDAASQITAEVQQISARLRLP
jgi:hypothetical protein